MHQTSSGTAPETDPRARAHAWRPPRRGAPSWLLPVLLAGVVLALTSCRYQRTGSGSPGVGDDEAALLDRIERERAHTNLRYAAEKERLEEASRSPRALDLDGVGSLIIHRVELLGGVDRPYLRARFTYVNTSGRSVPLPTISLVALSPAGRPVAEGARFLERTIGKYLEPDTSYTAWVDCDIGELYLAPGWDWTMDVAFDE